MAASPLCKPCKVAGLYSLVDLQKLCGNQCIKLSEETNDKILISILQRIGPSRAIKAVDKLIEDGYLTVEDNEYEVEQILDTRYSVEKGTEVFLVKWRNWPMKFNTWEPLSNLHNCEKAMAEYKQRSMENKRIDSVVAVDGSRKRKAYEAFHISNEDESDADDSDEENTYHKQLKEVFSKLRNSENKINPATLVHLSGIAEDFKKNNVFKPHLKKQASNWATKKHTKAYQEHKESLKEVLKAWETRFNSFYSTDQHITVENDVDLDAPPENFKLISDYLLMDGLVIEEMPLIGCECSEKCSASSKTCCPHTNDADFAYNKAKRVRLCPGSAIYECNKKCKCGPECWNRVVQLGSKVKLALFKTKTGCGWGVKTKQKIRKGTFVMEYLGEIITNEEAEKRGQVYDAEGFTYLFDLDFHGDDCQFTIDARNYGNISHFVNHSCDPNMSVYGVWVNNLDIRMPRIALFANRDIKAGEELSFDYKMTGDTSEEPAGGTEIPTPTRKMSPFKHSPTSQSRYSSDMQADVAAHASSDEFESSFSSHNSSNSSERYMDSLSPSSFYTEVKKKVSSTMEQVIFSSRSERDIHLHSNSVLNDPVTEASSSNFDTDTSSDVSNKQFSCKNYRIACHCGAANCKKFLF